MRRIYKVLQSSFESVLVSKEMIIYVRLDLFKACKQIHRRLLVTRWGIFEIGQCALELKRIIVVSNKARCDCSVEGHTYETIIDILGEKDVD